MDRFKDALRLQLQASPSLGEDVLEEAASRDLDLGLATDPLSAPPSLLARPGLSRRPGRANLQRRPTPMNREIAHTVGASDELARRTFGDDHCFATLELALLTVKIAEPSSTTTSTSRSSLTCSGGPLPAFQESSVALRSSDAVPQTGRLP